MKLQKIVENLLLLLPDVNSVAFLSEEGLPIVSATAADYDDDIIMEITSAFQQLSETVGSELKFKGVNEIIIRGEEGVILAMYVKHVDALLYVSANRRVKLGILIMEADRIVERLTSELF